MAYYIKLQLKYHLRSYSVQAAMASLLLIVLFPVMCGVAVGGHRYHHYPGCRNTVKAVPNMGESCSAILCSHRYKPVCGSDGEEYLNDCILCKAACSNKDLRKACDGFCPCGQRLPLPSTAPVLKPAPGPGIVPSGFCFGEGSCP